MVNYISYTLFGNKKYYYEGAIANAENNKIVLPKWRSVFYVSPTIEEKYSRKLLSEGAILKFVADTENYTSTIWRFFATSINDADAIIFRDSDSLISKCEVGLIDYWLLTKKTMHIIRDHPSHKSPILAGLCGLRKRLDIDLEAIYHKSDLVNIYGIDQWFIYTHLYKKFVDDSVIHDSIYRFEKSTIPFNCKLNSNSFIGERIFVETKPNHSRESSTIDKARYMHNKSSIKCFIDRISFFLTKYKMDIYFRHLMRSDD